MTKKRDDDRPSASNNLNRQLFFEAEIPPQASQDRHHLEVNPQLDRPGLNRLGGIDNGAPFFVMGISGVKKRSENAMRILAMSGNGV